MSDTNHRTSVFLGLKDNMSPGLRRITGEVDRTASAFARLASRAGGGIGGGLTAGLRGIAGVAGLATRGLLGLAKTAGGIVVGGLRAAANVARTTIGVFTGLVRTGAALAATLAGLVAAGTFKGIQAGAGRMAQFESLKNIEGSARRAARSMADLKRIARGPGIDFNQAIAGYSGLRAVRASAGLSKGLIGEFGNAVALNSGGPEQLQQVLRGVQQTFGKGKISAEELNQQILEPAPMVRQAIEKAFGTADSEKLTKILERQGLSVEQFWERVLVKMRQLPRAGDGAKNALENVGIAAKELTITFGQGFLGADGAKRISALGGWLESLDPIAKRLGQNMRRIFDRVSDKAGRMASEFKLAWRALKAGDTEGLSRMPQWAALLAENVQKGANWLREMGARAQAAGQYVSKFVGDFATAWRSMHGGLVDTDLLQGLDRNAVGAARGLKRMVGTVKSVWSDLMSGDFGGLGETLGHLLAGAYNLLAPWAQRLAKDMTEAGLKAIKGFIGSIRQEFPKVGAFLDALEERWKTWSQRLSGWINEVKTAWQSLTNMWSSARGQGKSSDDGSGSADQPATPKAGGFQQPKQKPFWDEVNDIRSDPENSSRGLFRIWYSRNRRRRMMEDAATPGDLKGWDKFRTQLEWGALGPPDDPYGELKGRQNNRISFGRQSLPLSFSSTGTVHTINVRVTTDREPSKQDLDKFNRHIRDWVREVNG